MKTGRALIYSIMLSTLFFSACGGINTPSRDGKLQVIATTTIVADVVAQIGREYVQVTTLLPPGIDPHTFEPRPQDAAALADTQIIFASGAGLEEFLEPLLISADASKKLVDVSQGIELITFLENENKSSDPHTWMAPNNLLVWVDNIAAALSAADPDHAATYQANAETYAISLRDLDAWIRSEVEQIPPDDRKLVSDHAVFGYFAREYGFIQVGTITGSFSTNAAPSAQELAALEDVILSYGVGAIFVGDTVNQELATQVVMDTGVKLITIYHASLSDINGPAKNYLEMMRYNVTAIVEALK